MGLLIDPATAPANYQPALSYGACPADGEPDACEKYLDRPRQADKAAKYFCEQKTTSEADCQKFLDFLAGRYYYSPRVHKFEAEIRSAGHTEQAVKLADQALTVAKMTVNNNEKIGLIAEVAESLINTGWLRKAEAILRSVAGERCVYTFANVKKEGVEFTDFCYNGDTIYNETAHDLIEKEAGLGNYKMALDLAASIKQNPTERVFAYDTIEDAIIHGKALEHKPELVSALKGHAVAINMVKAKWAKGSHLGPFMTKVLKLQADKLLTKPEMREILGLLR